MSKEATLQPKYFGAVFTKLYDEWEKEHPDKTQTDFGELFDPPISRQTITSWRSGKSIPGPHNLEQLLKIFGVTKKDFIPLSNADDYAFNEERQTRIASDTLIPFCEKIGLDIDFIKLAKKLLGTKYDELFPLWSPLQKLNNEYTRRGADSLAPAAPMADNNFFQIEVNTGSTTKLVDMTLTDLLFLKDLQDRISDTIEFEFMRRSRELINEVNEINEAAADPVVITPDGGTAFLRIDLFEFDKYSGRVRKILRRK